MNQRVHAGNNSNSREAGKAVSFLCYGLYMTWYKTYRKNPHKYNAKSTIMGGIKYDSKKEATYANDLYLMQRAGEIKEYSAKPRYDLRGLNGKKICTIIPDFLVIMPDGEEQVHEVKSAITMTPTWSIKRKLFEDNYPEIVYKVIL